MKVCSVDGCERKCQAKGMCQRHYKATWRLVNGRENGASDRFVEVPCTNCGSLVTKTATAARKYRPFCDYACRDAYRRDVQPNSGDAPRCKVPADHAVALLIAEQRASRSEPRPVARFTACVCPCGTAFLIDREAFMSHARYCSATCARRAHRRDRRAREGMRIHWTRVAKRDGMACHLCGDDCDPDDYTRDGTTFLAGITYPSVDHVIPLSLGGPHDLDNVRLAHMLCNSLRGTVAVA
jgi:5-methylcytosine-specific restriction endonuclease McrA